MQSKNKWEASKNKTHNTKNTVGITHAQTNPI